MKIQTYTRENFMEMESMHDFFASRILLEGKKLIIIYDNLDKDPLGIEGVSYYQHKKLTIEYMFDSYCDAELYCNYRNKKSVYLNLQEEKGKFDKALCNCTMLCHKFAVDSFGELMLQFGACGKSKYFSFEILLDPESVTYIWE